MAGDGPAHVRRSGLSPDATAHMLGGLNGQSIASRIAAAGIAGSLGTRGASALLASELTARGASTTETQIRFVEMVIDQLTARGVM